MLGSLLLTLSLASPTYADESAVRAISEKYARDLYPTEQVDAWWMKEKLLNRYPYMHAVVVAAFYANRKEQQDAAFRRLEKYKCENGIACRELVAFLNGALRLNRSAMKKEHIKRAEKIRASAQAREKATEGELPVREGLCNPHSRRAVWIALEYELFCPNVERQVLKFKAEKDSEQLLFSSSFLHSLKHIGPKDCSEPWKVELECSGSVERTFHLSCSKKGERVECKE